MYLHGKGANNSVVSQYNDHKHRNNNWQMAQSANNEKI